MSIKATIGHVLIKPDWDENEHKGLIVVPDAHKPTKVPLIGIVHHMSGAELTKNGDKIDPEFRPGDRVLYKEYSATLLDHEGEKYVQVKFGDIMAIMDSTGGIRPPQ